MTQKVRFIQHWRMILTLQKQCKRL